MQSATARPHISKPVRPLPKHAFPGHEINHVMAEAPTAQETDTSSYSRNATRDSSPSLNLPDHHGTLYPTASCGPFSGHFLLTGSLFCDPQ